MARFDFTGPGLKVRLTDPAIEGGVGLRIEHHSGAALIVSSTSPTRDERGVHLEVTGFDGTRFQVHLSPDGDHVRIVASQVTAILGGQAQAQCHHVPSAPTSPAPVRLTGHEATMPIELGDDD